MVGAVIGTSGPNMDGWGIAAWASSWFVAYAILARYAAYRWFDALNLAVPIWSLVWQCRICWRLAYLPHRDWAPRPTRGSS